MNPRLVARRGVVTAVLAACTAALWLSCTLASAAEEPSRAKNDASARKPSPLVGTWKLVSIDERDTDGKRVTPLDYGPAPIGILMYDASGHMSAQAVRRDRPHVDTEDVHRIPPEQAKQALVGFNGYFGTYDVDQRAGIVVHHVEGAMLPNWEGKDQRRRFTLSGDTLTLEPPPFLAAGQQHTRRLTWQRIQ
jgi:hypothetical protein